MNQLEIFEHPEFGAVRTMEIDGEPCLVGKNVAQTLGYIIPVKQSLTTLTKKTRG